MKYVHSNFEHEVLERTHPNLMKSKVWHQKTLPNTLNNQLCTIYRIFKSTNFGCIWEVKFVDFGFKGEYHNRVWA